LNIDSWNLKHWFLTAPLCLQAIAGLHAGCDGGERRGLWALAAGQPGNIHHLVRPESRADVWGHQERHESRWMRPIARLTARQRAAYRAQPRRCNQGVRAGGGFAAGVCVGVDQHRAWCITTSIRTRTPIARFCMAYTLDPYNSGRAQPGFG